MDLFEHFRAVVTENLDALVNAGVLPAGLGYDNVSVEPPRDPAHGDIATNAAMVLAKPAGKPPRELAEALVGVLGRTGHFASAEIAGPGFINMRLKPSFWSTIVRAILEQDANFGASDIGSGTKVNIEYVSANPTGPMHVGHCRGAVFGDALANLLEFAGYDVTREYYINDAGSQIEVLARSALLRYREALGQEIGPIPEGLYPGDYLMAVGDALVKKYGEKLLSMPESESLTLAGDIAIELMLEGIKADLADLDIRHDVFFSERTLTGGGRDRIADAIEDLRGKGLIFVGKIPPPKGRLPDDWEDRDQILFKSTAFGDDIDRPLMKSDGGYTYFAADIAYHNDKISRGFNMLIDIWGADHGGYVKRMKSAVQALSDGKASLDIKLCQLVRLYRNGKPVKMSKRAGEFVTLHDVVREVGRDPVRFMMLYRKNDAPLDFDFAKVAEQTRENPVFYVQYAHARIHSVLRNAGQLKGGLDLSNGAMMRANFDLLTHEAEIGIVKHLAAYPRVVRSAVQSHEPHRIAFYLYELATGFHALWNLGKELPQLRFISDDDNATVARIGLIQAVRRILSSGLGILGVVAVEEMR